MDEYDEVAPKAPVAPVKPSPGCKQCEGPMDDVRYKKLLRKYRDVSTQWGATSNIMISAMLVGDSDTESELKPKAERLSAEMDRLEEQLLKNRGIDKH